MTDPHPISLGAVQAFYEALASRDPIRIAPHLSDDVEWHMAGPVDVFAFCGYRRGKAAVVDYITRLVPAVFAVKRFDPEEVVVDGNCAGLLSKVTAVQKETGRIITYTSAVFVIFQDGKAVSVKGIADTFNAVEQVVGHRIDAYREAIAVSPRDVVTL